MPHDPTARAAASPQPIVLLGDTGRTVAPYTPADEDLAAARPAASHRAGEGISGPHLIALRRRHARNRTGVVGLSLGYDRRRGRHYVYVNLGSRSRCFCIETLGRDEAFRRALQLRRRHVEKVEAANRRIAEARLRHAGTTTDERGAA